MDTLATKRVYWLARLTFVWAAVIVARLVQLQIVKHDEFQRLALQQQEKVVEVQAPRGAILDRWNQRLAMSLPVESVCVNPLRVPDIAMSATILCKILNLGDTELAAQIKATTRSPPSIH